jgi:hypothetical protein
MEAQRAGSAQARPSGRDRNSEKLSAEGAAQNPRDSIRCAGPSGLPFDRALTPR